MKRSLPFLAVLVVGACVPPTKSVGEATETEGSNSSDGGSSTGTVPPETGGTSIDPPSSSESTTTDPNDVTTDDGVGTGEPPSFECPPSRGEAQCDPVAQDCPAGFHCVLWDDDEETPDGVVFVCSPLDEAPAGRFEACTSDPTTCSDDCDVGTYCAHHDGMDLCIPTCSGDGDDAACLADEVCATCSDCIVGNCLPRCDPLDPQCPDALDACLFSYGDDVFACFDAPLLGDGLGEACDYINECAEGLYCAPEDLLGPSCTGAGCCTEFCDLQDGDPACSTPGHVCLPFYLPGTAPDDLEHVGLCGVPEGDPCLEPGACPPPGIDDTYPWCTTVNEAYCPEGSLAGYSNGITCESGCLCYTSCVEDVDCPAPPTGTAVPECVEEPYGLGSPTSCLLRCENGEICPDGMTCTDVLWGDSICSWIATLPPEDC